MWCILVAAMLTLAVQGASMPLLGDVRRVCEAGNVGVWAL